MEYPDCEELSDAELAMLCRVLSSGKDLPEGLQSLEISEATFHRWRNQHGGMKGEEAKRLKELETEIRRLKRLLVDRRRVHAPVDHIGRVAQPACRPDH